MKVLTAYNPTEEAYMALSLVKKGDFIKRKAKHNKVYTKGDYDRSSKKYWLNDCDDISRAILVKPSALVYCNFEY